MKQISTLVLATALSFSSAFGQINQTFETVSGLAPLTNNCWQFSDITFMTTSRLNDANCLAILPTTSTGVSALVITPYVNLTSASTINFNYKLSNSLATTASRSVIVRLQDIDGNYTPVGSFTLTRSSSTATLNFSGTSPVTGVRKIVIDIQGNGDGNSYLYLDNFSIAGSFNYNSPYGCNSTADGTLPVHLKNFQGSMAADKVNLQWSVSENEGGNYFEVERSAEGKEFKTVGIVMTTERKGDELYSFADQAQGKVFYRLKIVSKGKAPVYSNILVMKAQGPSAHVLNLLQNPVQQTLKFSFLSEINGTTEIAMYNMLGVKVYTRSFQAVKGVNSISSNLTADIKEGTYVLEVRNTMSRSVAKLLKN